METTIRHHSRRPPAPHLRASAWLLLAAIGLVLVGCDRGGPAAGSAGSSGDGAAGPAREAGPERDTSPTTEAGPAGMAGPAGGMGPAGAAGPAGGPDASRAPVEPEEAALAYARCVRDNGFPDWPDPDADGRMRIIMGPGTTMDPNDPRLQRAMAACQDLRPAAMSPQRPGEQDAEAVEAAMAFARCMRENGVPEFPDPEPDGVIAGGGQAMVGGRGAGVDRDDPRVRDAMQSCSEALPFINVR